MIIMLADEKRTARSARKCNMCHPRGSRNACPLLLSPGFSTSRCSTSTSDTSATDSVYMRKDGSINSAVHGFDAPQPLLEGAEQAAQEEERALNKQPYIPCPIYPPIPPCLPCKTRTCVVVLQRHLRVKQVELYSLYDVCVSTGSTGNPDIPDRTPILQDI